MKSEKVLVTGAGGFIGHHLVKRLKEEGYFVRGVDLVRPHFEESPADEFFTLDLREKENALTATEGMDHVYSLAADMGGMGFISTNHALILHNNVLINTHGLEAAREKGVSKYFFASSACVYPLYKQTSEEIAGLKEDDAYPAQPEDAYGWEKLISERLCKHYLEDHGLQTRVARFHNIFGPLGTWRGGREKAPAALCRKVALAKLTGKNEVEIWGDGKQTRSFCFVDDCVEGIYRLMHSEYENPLNIGQDRLISINGLASLISKIADCEFELKHVPGPQGVRGRNSDNTRAEKVLHWRPEISLEEGLRQTYQWVEQQVKHHLDNKLEV